MRNIWLYLFVTTFFLLGSCHEQQEITGRLELQNNEALGISFKNTLEDNLQHNALVYETFYNGGGVAVGDINNDGLQDLYFSGNQVGDHLYLNKGNWNFEDITASAGIRDDGSWSTGVTMVDINNDGLLDIYVCKSLYDDSPELRANKLYINKGNNTFDEKANAFGLADIWRSQEACFFDYDHDGDQDVLLINQPPNPGPLSPFKGTEYRVPELGVRFFENRNNQFSDVTEKVGLSHSGYPLSASIGDLNNDGWLDIYIAHDFNSPDKMFINNQGESFRNTINQSCKQISFFSMGTDMADINNDGLEDIISLDMAASDPYRIKANMGGMDPASFWQVVDEGGHYQYMYNALQINSGIENGVPLFSNIANQAGLSSTDWSWSSLIEDFDNDGLKDIFISNGIKRDLRFTDGIRAIRDSINLYKQKYGLTQENINENVNGLKWLEMLPSTKLSNYIFKNNDGLTFDNVTVDWASDQKAFSTGAAVADLDNDGDLDLIVNNLDEVPYIYRNEISDNNFIRINPVEEEGSTISIVGVKVALYSDNMIQINDVSTNQGWYSSSESIVHFGLGSRSEIDSVVVWWNDKHMTSIVNPPINKTIDIVKGPQPTPRPEINLSTQLEDIASQINLDITHRKDNFDDYSRQILLPHEIGVNDMAVAVTDLNGDQTDDIVVGGDQDTPCRIYFQSENGNFVSKQLPGIPLGIKITDIAVLDMQGDGYLDMYITSGGNSFEPDANQYANYLVVNRGNENFDVMIDNFSLNVGSDSQVKAFDKDNDGDQDLLICSRHIPGRYPFPASSTILENKSSLNEILFSDVTRKIAVDLEEVGMVTEALISDLDLDGDSDIVLVGEWMPITIFENVDNEFRKNVMEGTVGWWMTIAETDFNKDGLPDFLVGNLGQNAKYKVNDQDRFSVYYDDFDQNSASDIVLAYEKGDAEFPLRGRSCSSQQMPELKESFPTYHVFASSTLQEVYGERIEKSNKISMDLFDSALMINNGQLNFDLKVLPSGFQSSSINHIHLLDDYRFLAVGNFNFMEIETPKIDASYGVVFSIDSLGNFTIDQNSFGSTFSGQVEDIKNIQIGDDSYYLWIPIYEKLKLISNESIMELIEIK